MYSGMAIQSSYCGALLFQYLYHVLRSNLVSGKAWEPESGPLTGDRKGLEARTM